MADLKILILAVQASAKFGGESILPLHYYQGLKRRNIAVKMAVHERTKSELETLFDGDLDDITFIRDTRVHKFLVSFSKVLPARIYAISFGLLLDLMTESALKSEAKKIIKSCDINVVHVPIRVSPKFPSLIYGMGAPVIFGPLNGGMTFPKAFQHMQKGFEKYTVGIGRFVSNFVNRLIPGKYLARTILVSNERTKRALPYTKCNDIRTVIENGVDMSLFYSKSTELSPTPELAEQFSLVFVGRLVDWKCVDVLLKAIAKMEAPDIHLHIVGEGKDRGSLESLAKLLNISDNVHFHGFVPQRRCAEILEESNCLILPSVYECGGAVVLEAMAMSKPVIATNWGGPIDYINQDTGILVEVGESEAQFVDNLKSAIIELKSDREKALTMGKNGKVRICEEFDWNKKIENMISIYHSVLD